MENVLIMFDSLLMAFSLYSRIPVPQAEWNDRSMKYCICFLPLVGVVIGAVQYGLLLFLDILNAGPVLRGALLAFLPVFLSGGIHMDGFLDTCDAIHSWKGPEERLRILKDPHVGAFAVIGGLLYFLLAAGIWSEADTASALTLSLVFVLSRALSAFSALFFPKAKKDGMLRGETDPAAKGAIRSHGSRRAGGNGSDDPDRTSAGCLWSRGFSGSASYLLQDSHAHVRWNHRRFGGMVSAALRTGSSGGGRLMRPGDDGMMAV